MFLRIMLGALLAAGMVSAQRGSRNSNSNNQMGEMPRQRQQSKLDVIAEKLGLNKEQKEEFQKIVAQSAEQAATVTEQLRNGRQMIASAMISGRDNGADWDKLKSEYTAVLAQETMLETQSYQKLYAILKDKQKNKAAPVFAELMSGLFERAGGGGGRTR